MKRNKLLIYSLYFFRFVQLCLVLLLITGIILLVYYQLAPDQFSNYKFIPTSGKIELIDIEKIVKTNNAPGGTISLVEVKPVFLYLIYLQLVSLFFLFWLVIQEFKKVIRSLQQLQTFQNCNVEAFRKMGKYFLLIFILSNFSFFMIGEKGSFTINFDLTFAMMAVATFILAEIFKEGNRLQEEHQLTV